MLQPWKTPVWRLVRWAAAWDRCWGSPWWSERRTPASGQMRKGQRNEVGDHRTGPPSPSPLVCLCLSTSDPGRSYKNSLPTIQCSQQHAHTHSSTHKIWRQRTWMYFCRLLHKVLKYFDLTLGTGVFVWLFCFPSRLWQTVAQRGIHQFDQDITECLLYFLGTVHFDQEHQFKEAILKSTSLVPAPHTHTLHFFLSLTLTHTHTLQR